MTKSIFVFAVLAIFVLVAVWFILQKTKEVNQADQKSAAQESETPSAIPESGRPVKYDNGLVVQDLVSGTGKSAENGDLVSANYIGMLENGTEFDNSYKRGEPLQFQLGAGQLIKGWELGLIGMKEGGKRKLIIPPDLGYGSRGAGNIIPPNATLVFEIELVSVTKK